MASGYLIWCRTIASSFWSWGSWLVPKVRSDNPYASLQICLSIGLYPHSVSDTVSIQSNWQSLLWSSWSQSVCASHLSTACRLVLFVYWSPWINLRPARAAGFCLYSLFNFSCSPKGAFITPVGLRCLSSRQCHTELKPQFDLSIGFCKWGPQSWEVLHWQLCDYRPGGWWNQFKWRVISHPFFHWYWSSSLVWVNWHTWGSSDQNYYNFAL